MDKINEIIAEYGDPVMRFVPSGDFTQDQIMECNMPKEIAVFRMPKHRVDEFIVFSRYGNEDNWTANSGERWVIRELLNAINGCNIEIAHPVLAKIRLEDIFPKPKNKPCPKCGGTNLIFACNSVHGHGDSGYTHGRIQCKDCSCSIGNFNDYGEPTSDVMQKAWDLWNGEWRITLGISPFLIPLRK